MGVEGAAWALAANASVAATAPATAAKRRSMGGSFVGRLGGRAHCPGPAARRQCRLGLGLVSGRALGALTCTMRTLASRIVHTERAEFVGRRRELLVAETPFAPHAPASVLLVHGPSGIGKSMLLREIARRGADAGWTPFALDPRDLAPDVRDVERPLLLIDDYEATSALGARLRAALLPARAVVVIAGREDPERAWFEGGWETVTLELPLKPLSAQESRRLLERLGLDGDPRTGAIIAWAGGRPLSLRLGATAARTDPEWAPGRESAALCAHLRRIVEAGPDGAHPHGYAPRGVAPGLTPPMLADLLPDVDAPAALRWLAGCGFALHPAVRQRLRAELRAREPQLERELRGRVADFLHARGDLALTVDLADLVEDPTVRSGYNCDGKSDYHVSGAGPDDEALARDEAARAFLRTGHALVARDAAGRPAGYSIAFTSDTDSALAGADPRLGRWLAHAPANAIVWRDCVDLTPDPRSCVQALLNVATVLDCGLRNPRYAYLPIA